MSWGRPNYGGEVRLCDIQSALDSIPFRTPVMGGVEKFIRDAQFRVEAKRTEEYLKEKPDASQYITRPNRETFTPFGCLKDRGHYMKGKYYDDKLLNTLNMDKPLLEYGSPDYHMVREKGGVDKWSRGDGIIRDMEYNFKELILDSASSYELWDVRCLPTRTCHKLSWLDGREISHC